MRIHLRRVAVLIFLLILAAVGQQASSNAASPASLGAPPPLIQFSGLATDEGGTPFTGNVRMTFTLYPAQREGEPLWSETLDVQVDGTGHYSIQLGVTKSGGVPALLFATGEARWLGVRIAGLEEQPRVLLVSVPYALKAGDAATLGGLPASAFLLAVPGNGSAAAMSAADATTASSNASSDVTTKGGTVNKIPLFTTATNIQTSALTQTGSGTTAKIGINMATPATVLDVNGGATIRGSFFLAGTGTATATGGKNSQPEIFTASVFNSTTSTAVPQKFQWQAEPSGNDTATPSGTLNLLFASGTAAAAETGLKIASNGQITFAAGQTFPGTGGGTITGVTTAKGSGLMGGGTTGTLNLGLTNTCAANQVLQWNGTAWGCASVGTGTITGVTAGMGLTGGGTTGAVTVNLDTTKVPLLGTANTFTGNQTVNGAVTATSFTGNGSGLTNVNANLLGGAAAGSFATLSGNTFNGTQFIGGSGTSATLQIDANGVNTGSLLPGIRFGVGASGEGLSSQRVGTTNLNGLDLYTNSTARISITNSGNVGIGTKTPGAALDIASGGILVEGTGDGSGTSLIPNQILFQDNGEIASLDANHRIIFDRSHNVLELREFGTILFSPGTNNGQGTNQVFFTPTAADIFYNFNVTGLTTMGSALQTAQLAVTSTGPLDGSDITGYSSPSGSGGGGTRGIQAIGGNADPASQSVVTASDGLDALGGNATPTFGTGGLGVMGVGGNGGFFGGDGGYFVGGNPLGDGIYAKQGTGVNPDAGYFDGDVYVSGTLTAGAKNFRLDDPLDPANKYLVHASVESSEMMNIYTGNTVLDAEGAAVIELPKWFSVLNNDFRYQLTSIGAPGPNLYVAEEIVENRFKIAGGHPGAKVSWQVTGVRQDPFAQAHPLVVEEAKIGREQGHYLHPELYGAGEELSVSEARHPGMLRRVQEMEQQAEAARAAQATAKLKKPELPTAEEPVVRVQTPLLPPANTPPSVGPRGIHTPTAPASPGRQALVVPASKAIR
ncbi:MAG: hypothetical protein ACLP6G_21920 [Terriglobales bacterium]